MRSNYKRLGDYIKEVNERNSNLAIIKLIGVSMEKTFIPSVANIIDTDMSVYKILRKGQLACKLMSVGRDEKLPVDLYKDDDPAIVSSAYYVFEPIDENILLPEFLLMWLCRPENDRYLGFISGGDVRGGISWDTFCDIPINIPLLGKQKEIVKEYNTILNRIEVNNQLIQKLEETAQAIYKEWFVDFEFPNENGKPYKSCGGEMESNEEIQKVFPKNWEVVSLGSICSKIGSGATPLGGNQNYHKTGISLIRSMNVHDYIFSSEALAHIDDIQAKALEFVTLQKQDILLNITGVSVARCCKVPDFILPARVNQHVMIIRPKTEYNLSYYILCLLCYSENKSKLLSISQSGSTREAITKSEIEEFKIVLPNKAVLKSFEEKLNCLSKMIESKIQQNNSLTELRNILLSKLATI